ncbi:two-component system NtrC family response regulator [Methylohalomonas lacus]|uniref:Two-component system NtrC family response regulator n=1 Tax=Methylohalomonas lacus TaxID=398773 RepID=A0AAE3HLA9_9GAMM|nr:PEP-CTERM-box response regulator transcription factor [Methylohalomonas lacus]MCS3904339.1 two-component system NtrC family response regulator [Methylohalomonas lacus]
MTFPPEKNRSILIVEDDPGLLKQMYWCFPDYVVFEAGDRETALDQVRRHRPPVITLDLGLPPDSANATVGMEVLSEILSCAPETKVIVVTGNGEREYALKAVELGAYDFYQKPMEPDVLSLIVDRAYKLSELEQENRRLAESNRHGELSGLVASSPQMAEVCRMVEKVGPTEVSTLLLGATGTGKELLARALHNLSPRRNELFVAINCAAIPDNLLESELFGYEKGAFTGAQKRTPGKIEYAAGGTLFLDEIGDLPLHLQAKILRFLQERLIVRVGGREEIQVDVRIICATHQDLSDKIEIGQFREDLYYRISEITIHIPSLHERSGDSIVLAKHFLEVYCREIGKTCRLDKSAIAAIEEYTWPGNIRELENKIKRAIIMSEDGQIRNIDLELPDSKPDMPELRAIRSDAERQALVKAMDISNFKVSRAAKLLNVSRPTLYDLLEKHGIKN